MAKMYICVACVCSLVDVQMCFIITFRVIRAINRIINAHNSEAVKDIFVILCVTYSLQKVPSGWGELWGCWARGQFGHCGLGSDRAR